MKTRRKKKSLLARITAISLILGAASMFFSGFMLYLLFRSRAEENMEKSLREHIYTMNCQLYNYESIDWLLSYWHEHYAEMALPPFDGNNTYEKWCNEHIEIESVNAAALTTREILEMSQEKQRVFADYCYLSIYDDLARLCGDLDIDVFSCFAPDDIGEEAFAFFLSTREDKSIVEQRMVLGETWEFHPEEHPELMGLYKPDSDIASGVEVIRSRDDGTAYATVYSLIWNDQKPLCITSVSQSMKELMDEVWSDVFNFEKWVALIILIAILTILFMIYRTSLKPTLLLAQDIRSYTQNHSAEKLSNELESLISRRDEIGMLAADIREMVEQNERYFKQQLENEELKTKILIAQIKPHFIYNCLTVIRSFLDEPEKAEDALNHFAGFLRGSVDLLEETQCIRADREFNTVDHYLYMQKQRFEDQLTIVTDYQDRNFFLPAFSVQILVENAVDHGIRGTKDGTGTVFIRSYEKDGFHVIEVEDDGVGMLTESDKPDSPEDRLHVGLKNIEKRLKMMCGGTLSIDSAAGKGTKATIIIPKDQKRC